MYFNKREALRYFGAEAGDQRAGVAVDLAFLKLRNELQPRYTCLRLPCRVETERVVVMTAAPEVQVTAAVQTESASDGHEDAAKTSDSDAYAGANMTVAQVLFNSQKLAAHLKGCREIYLFGATLGTKVDIALRRLMLLSAAEGAAGQAVAAALIETYCDDCCREMEEKLPAECGFTSRFSPGYGDWKLEEQKTLFRLLNCAKLIGLTLTEGGMMAPIKSVTAVLGVREGQKRTYAPALDQEVQGCPVNKCSQCTKYDCEFRRC